MTAPEHVRESRRGEALATFLGAVLVFLLGLPLVAVPFGAPAGGATLLAAGLIGRRAAAEPLSRGLVRGAVLAGAALLVLGLVVALAHATGRGVEVDSG